MHVCQGCYEIIGNDEPWLNCPECGRPYHVWARCLKIRTTKHKNKCIKCGKICSTHRYCPNCGSIIYSLCKNCLSARQSEIIPIFENQSE